VTSLETVRRQIKQARRWNKTPSELLHLDGWCAYLWDQACDWLEVHDAQQLAKKPDAPTEKESGISFGAYG